MAITDRGTGDIEMGPSGPAADQLQVRDIVAGGWHTLRLSGELDLVSTVILADAAERIAMDAIDGVVLDLSGVEFMDSTGVRSILALQDSCARASRELRIIPGPRAVQRVFEVTGLLERLPFQAPGSARASAS